MHKKINRKTVEHSGSVNTWISILLVVIILHLIVIFSVMGFRMLKGGNEIPKSKKELPQPKELNTSGEDYLIPPPPEENNSLETVLNSLIKPKTPSGTEDKGNEPVLPPVDVDGLISPPDPSEETTASEASVIGKSPVGTPTQPLKTANSIENTGNYYIVVEGDTLRKIATKTGTSIDEIRKKNHLDKDVVKLGQKLIIPGKSSDKTLVSDAHSRINPKPPANAVGPMQKPAATAAGNYKLYRVGKGDTLNKIATLFHTTPENLSKINNISDPRKLKTGMEIKVPKE